MDMNKINLLIYNALEYIDTNIPNRDTVTAIREGIKDLLDLQAKYREAIRIPKDELTFLERIAPDGAWRLMNYQETMKIRDCVKEIVKGWEDQPLPF